MPNAPYLDASVQWRIRAGTLDLHESGYRSTVETILSSGLATEVAGLISAGKEADVYLARYNSGPLAVKVYRLYRTSHRGGGPIKADSMGWRAAQEFEMTRQAWKGGARVPAPARRVENMFSMRYLGNDDGPAPRLQDVRLDDPGVFLESVLEAVDALARAGVVHTDLSPFNILVFQGEPWFIDLAGAIRVDRTGTAPWMRLEQAREALVRGGASLGRYFRRYGCVIDSEGLADRIVASRDRFHVLDGSGETVGRGNR